MNGKMMKTPQMTGLDEGQSRGAAMDVGKIRGNLLQTRANDVAG